MIRFPCPGCDHVIEVNDDEAGLTLRCPECGRRNEVPAPAGGAPRRPSPPADEPAPEPGPPPRTSRRDRADEDLVAVEDCPECGKRVQVPEEDIGHRVECPRCGKRFVARKPGKRRRDEDDDEDDRPRKRDRDDDEDDRPRKSGLTREQLELAHSKKTTAGICGILLGPFGVHKFILGYTTPGVIMLLVTLLTLCIAAKIMWIIGIVEGITYLSMTDEKFYKTYIQGQKEWF